jgi:hypothetical protein
MDLLNQYIIQRFSTAGAKIYLLEDGTATMCYYNTIPREPPFKDRIKTFILKKFYHFTHTSIKMYGVEILPVMDDSVFTGVIVNFGNSILRNITLYKLAPMQEPIKVLYKSGAIFFNQAMYFWFISKEEYVSYLKTILTISKNFTPFYFKFHPSDTDSIKLSVKELIDDKYKNIKIISEDDIAESIINKYPVKYAITFNSTAVLNLINRGVVPIFMNDILYKSFSDSSFVVFREFLKSISCSVPEVLSDVKPGFCAFKSPVSSSKTYSIVEIINNN